MGSFTSRNDDSTSAPWAYINWIFFDEQYNYAGGGFDRIGRNGIVKDHNNSTIPTITAPRNGYVFVYCSNESQYNVFFDNLQVIHTRGALLEETHYYPFGLTIAGISSKALNFGTPENKYKYNGIEHNNDFDLNMYDAYYRNLDPQIGRFWQIDPVTTHSESPYVAMQDNPVSKFDGLGDYFTWANSGLEDRYKRLRQENADRITGYMNELSKLDINSEDEKVQTQIKELTGLINAHGELNSQWNEMEQSATEFHVSDDAPQEKGAFGDTRFNSKDNRVDIRAGRDDKYNGLSNMAHEFRHAYSYISGELIVGRNNLYDMTDEVVAYNAGFLFLDRATASKVVNGYYNVDWFKENKLSGYKSLNGREEALGLNTVAATYLKYFNDDRIAHMMNINKNNANYTVKDAIDALNGNAEKYGRQPEYKYGSMLNNK